MGWVGNEQTGSILKIVAVAIKRCKSFPESFVRQNDFSFKLFLKHYNGDTLF